MSSTSTQISKYIQSRGIKGPWKISGAKRDDFAGAVVIPSLAEADNLFKTLHSLAQNPPEILQRFWVLIVVNNRRDAPLAIKEDNFQTLQRLKVEEAPLKSLLIGWIEAASPGLELPAKGGVGLARKIGFDLALLRLTYDHPAPLLVSLDADTLVRPDYLPALIRHFQNYKSGGAVIPFCHQKGKTEEQERAIERYELFLRAYVLGLAGAGSPYAFHTVGSAMACTAEAYVKAGGMNSRAAGEDFYFLQQLAKTGGISQVKGTVVYPSARASNRVPFGTGRSISLQLAQGKGVVLFYQKDCFRILQDWLNLIAGNLATDGDKIQNMAHKIFPPLADFLDEIQFAKVWLKLQKNYSNPSVLFKAFHGWFDGLKTMKLIHHLSAGPFPRGEPEEVLPELLQWAGLESARKLRRQLDLLRDLQIGEAYCMGQDNSPRLK